MRVALYVDTISEHQIPLASALLKEFGIGSVRYFYVKERAAHRTALMGSDAMKMPWTIKVGEDQNAFEEWIENADVLYTIFRLPDLFERRIKKGLRTFYMSERWLKPPTRWIRLLHPGYFSMAKRMLRCFDSGLVTYLPTGVVAAMDMLRICHLLKGELVLASRIERPSYDPHVGSVVGGLNWMRMWGYFVAPGSRPAARRAFHSPLRVLWVGRYLALKRVDVLIRAIKLLGDISLDLYGCGREEDNLRKLAGSSHQIHFYGAINLSEVREQMRTHDVYVMPSNGFDGWGAVVSEALEEGMVVLGSDVVGAPATILPQQNLFKVGDVLALAYKLRLLAGNVASDKVPQYVNCEGWRVEDAANFLISQIRASDHVA